VQSGVVRRIVGAVRARLAIIGLIVAGCGSRGGDAAPADVGEDSSPGPSVLPRPTTTATQGTAVPRDRFELPDTGGSRFDGGFDADASDGGTGIELPAEPPTCTMIEDARTTRAWFDGAGNLLVEARDAGTERIATRRRTYDAAGRLTSQTITTSAGPNAQCFDYVPGFLSIRQCDRTFYDATYHLDAAGRVDGLLETTWTRDDEGAVLSSNGEATPIDKTTTTYGIDDRGRLRALDTLRRSTFGFEACHLGFAWTDAPTSFGVAWEAGSNSPNPTQSCKYTFDALDRLVTASCGDSTRRVGNTWSYDASGAYSVVGDSTALRVRRFSAGCPRPLGRDALAKWLVRHGAEPDPRLTTMTGWVPPHEMPSACVFVRL
jgi:YD repeat-containing protein